MNLPQSSIAPIILCLGLVGCGRHIPDCDDPAIGELVADMVEDHYDERPTAPLSGAVVAEVKNIRTISFNADTQTRQCVGKVSITGSSAIQAELNKKTEVTFKIGPSEKDQGYSVTLQWP